MNVLSIDFDIIMAPDINLYNGMVRPGPKGEDSTVDKLSEDFPMLKGCRADLYHYNKICTYLLTKLDSLNVDDIRISFSHEDIKYMLNECSDVHMYTIDHHHDLGYPEPGDNTPVQEIPCTCANWGDHYFRNGTILKFTWLKNSNSDIHKDYQEDNRVEMIDFSEFEMESLPKMDKIFICLSPEWVPSMYHPLFYNLLDLINIQKKCHLEVH